MNRFLFAKRLDSWLAPSDAFILLFAALPHAFWLDREHHQQHRFSVIGASAGGIVESDLDSLKRLLNELKWPNDISVPFDFRPGLVGAFSYEGESDLLFICESAIVFDHDAKQVWFVGVHENEDDFEHWINAALLRFALVGGQQLRYRAARGQLDTGKPELRHSSERYLQLIERSQQHISVGDVYQICLTNEISVQSSADPLMTFLRLREANPAPYAAYLRAGDRSVVSASPEQFLQVNAKGMISTKPIKGTRRRSQDRNEDASIAAELQSNLKERAENLMIVDLMRNDLGRVCAVGSIDVPKLFEIETYATVHQLVSTVVGKMRPDLSVLDVLAAAFPGGSMTGAPKIRAMEILGELEAGKRGIYSGVLGYIGANNVADLGMVIRTLVFDGERVTIGVGGGITIDSVPVDELEETRLKAGALLAAIGAADPWAR